MWQLSALSCAFFFALLGLIIKNITPRGYPPLLVMGCMVLFGVPFYLMTGKRLETSYAEINLVLKDSACKLFGNEQANIINIRIQPDEGIAIKFNSKNPGTKNLTPVTMEFCHGCEFGIGTPEAYEKLLHEVFIGDQTLFTRFDELEASWKFIDPIIKNLKKKNLIKYKAGIIYPEEVETLLKKDGREIVTIERKHTV